MCSKKTTKTKAFTPPKGSSSLYSCRKVHNHDPKPMYCPRLALYLVGKIHNKSVLCTVETCLIDHIKAQMVKADFIKCQLGAKE